MRIKVFRWSGAGLMLLLLTGWAATSSDLFFQITRNLEIFSKVYRLILLNYTDEIEPGQFMTHGIHAMLETLDPYTNFIEASSTEMDMMMGGNTGGIGISVMKNSRGIIITDVQDGFAAQRGGLRPGDQILAVDSVTVTSLTDLAARLRGTPGSLTTLTIRRDGFKEPFPLRVARETHDLSTIPAVTLLPDSVGYIRLTRFNKNAGDELRKALVDLQKQRCRRLILDLRGNPGGRLDEAVNVSSRFLPPRTLIVSMKGRNEDSRQDFFSEERPVFGTGKVVVLIDSLSASAAEIVAGALQDHDRAVLVGTRTYGKGLVQTIHPVAYETSLKITTARYYTPSGRCIQIEPINQLFATADTTASGTRVFRTDSGRIVPEGTGILPDVAVPLPPDPEPVQLIRESRVIRRLAGVWKDSLTEIPSLSPDPRIWTAFLNQVKRDLVFEQTAVATSFSRLSTAASAYLQADTQRRLKESEAAIRSDFYRSLNQHQETIWKELRRELMLRKWPMNTVIQSTWQQDPQLKVAHQEARKP